MKVCHVITRMIVGGAQENTFLSALGLYEAGHDVTLLTGPSSGPEGELLKQCGDIPFRVVEYPRLCRNISPINDMLTFFHLVRFFRKEKFDVVHTHSSKAGIVGRYAATVAHVPIVVHTIHGLPFSFTLYSKWKNFFYIILERWAAKHCTKILAVAQDMIDQCRKQNIGYDGLFEVVYSGMRLKDYLGFSPNQELRTTLGIPPDVPVVATLARLFYGKGYMELWRSIPEILKRIPNTCFLIIGNGVLRDELERISTEKGFREHIVFAGLIPPKDVPKYLSLADVLVHFSRREGLPRAAVQALALKIPVVAFDVDGTREVVIDGETGYLIQDLEQETPGVEQICGLLENKGKRIELGSAGCELIKRNFDWKMMSNHLIKIYQKLLQNGIKR